MRGKKKRQLRLASDMEGNIERVLIVDGEDNITTASVSCLGEET